MHKRCCLLYECYLFSNILSLAREEEDIILSKDEVHKKLDDLVSREIVNTASRLETLKWQPRTKCKMLIPLCRMISLPVVRPYLKNDVLTLASHFMKCGYMEGNGYFYVALENNFGVTVDVTPEITGSWSAHWVKVNEQFEKRLLEDDDLKVFSNKMFMVWDGNHRLQAWMPIIDRDHAHDISWHYCVETVILDPRGDVASILTALHEVNWYVCNLSLILGLIF